MMVVAIVSTTTGALLSSTRYGDHLAAPRSVAVHVLERIHDGKIWHPACIVVDDIGVDVVARASLGTTACERHFQPGQLCGGAGKKESSDLAETHGDK